MSASVYGTTVAGAPGQDNLSQVDVENPDVVAAVNAIESVHAPGISQQAVVFAASITPNPALGETIIVGALTGNITVANPTAGLQSGRFLSFQFVQDGTGGRTISWGNQFKVGPYQAMAFQVALTPAAVSANTAAEQLFVLAELTTSDLVLGVSKPTAQAGLGVVGFRVSSAGHFGLTFGNFTASPITPTAAETYSLDVMKQPGQPAMTPGARSTFTFRYDSSQTLWHLVGAELNI